MKNKSNRKKLGFKRFLRSFGYSFDGLKYAYLNEQSLVIHLIAGIIIISLSVLLNLSETEWLFVLLYIGLIMATELINTSIEATIDLISPEKHPLAKIAKDTASAAVFVFSSMAAIGGLLIFVPKIIKLI